MTRRLITTWHNEPNQDRRAEYEECLGNNLNSRLFDEIHILTEESFHRPAINTYIRLHRLSSRPTYNDCFRLINKLVTSPDDISVIANADIYFDDTLFLVDAVDMTDCCFALSRWDVQPDGAEPVHYLTIDSQDAWIFAGGIRASIDGDIQLGRAGCDNAIAHRIAEAGYAIANPSRSIRSLHLHLTGVRNYNPVDKVPEPYLLLPPTVLEIGGNLCV